MCEKELDGSEIGSNVGGGGECGEGRNGELVGDTVNEKGEIAESA